MTESFFHHQMQRLKTKWPRAFDAETVRMIASDCKLMSEQAFLTMVNGFIRNRGPNHPPTGLDFLEGARAEEKRRFDHDLHKATEALSSWPTGSLRRALDANPDWRGCKSAMEAIEVEAMKLQIKRANEK